MKRRPFQSLRARDQGTFYCFSPPVMIATFLIEIVLAAYAVIRYKWRPAVRLSVALLFFLAVFQLAEFLVCQGLGGDALFWSRIGFVAITTLPPLGMHLTYVLAGTKPTPKTRPLLIPAYVTGACFILFFALVGQSLAGHACMGNYVIFQVAPGFGGLYGLHYYGWLIATLLTGWYFVRTLRDHRAKKAIRALMFGYAIFLIPTTTAGLVSPAAIGAMPSVMCGFAVLLALVLSFIVLPLGAKRKTKKK